MSRKNRDSITMTGDAANRFIKSAMAEYDTTIKADGPPTTDEENAREMAPGIEQHDTTPPTKLRDCDPGSGDIVTPTVERTGADIIADLLASKLRIECERARWDALADELGKRAKEHGQTRVPCRIGGIVYKIKFTKETKAYSLVEAVEPGEIK